MMCAMHTPPTDEITGRECLPILGLTNPSTIVRMVREGRLTPSRKLPGLNGPYMFWRADVERMAAERAAAAKAS